jgi:hypothetical protein
MPTKRILTTIVIIGLAAAIAAGLARSIKPGPAIESARLRDYEDYERFFASPWPPASTSIDGSRRIPPPARPDSRPWPGERGAFRAAPG